MRQKMADEAHEARHPERVAERTAYRAACEQARNEREKAFPVITADNFEAACAFQDRRIFELLLAR
jgi:hypothetical protein